MSRESDNKKSRMAQVTEFYLRGLSQLQIAEKLGVSRSTIINDLRDAREIWKERASAAISAHLHESIAKLDEAESAAWDGWNRSQRDAVQTTTEDIDRSETAETKLKIVRVPQAGNPAFLKIVSDVIRQRCELLGLLDPDVRREMETDDYNDVVSVVIETREEAAALNAMTFEEFQDAKRKGLPSPETQTANDGGE